MSEKFECKHCSRTFDLKEARNQHMSDKHSENYKLNQTTISKKLPFKKIGIAMGVILIFFAIGYGFYNLSFTGNTASSNPSSNSNTDISPTEKLSLSFSSAVGKKAPDFSLENIDGKTIKLSDYKGKVIVLFFNEGEMCYPACWDQMVEFANDKRFDNDNVITFSIVIDQKTNWLKIVKDAPEFGNAKILFDPTRTVSSAYDVLSLQSSMHPPSDMHPGGYPGHTYFLIDKEGIIRYTFDDPNMAIGNDKLAGELEKLA